ncbi:nitrate- and nitrite sensing domain-containing protein [Nonomuraea sp. 3-1Str]|uniref:sensor histidine kinase n=1 Tax=Nonomuraea sp. 3-1Str TaxID=2929801 RepID=UPI00285F7766|nr:nitrate- and nitrite sensing domain-containing protein [Nonomuraea sp. 3-1Str]MDR8410686.1 nitrate- and nitrite sensing domain-containing protein [Nonomuraea sp. 3-1Str]
MRWRLTALILVPTVVCVALGGARVVGSIQSISDYERTIRAAEDAGHIRDLVQAVGLERDTGGGWVDATRALRRKLAKPYAERKAAVDQLVKTVQADMNAMDDSYGVRVLDVVKRARLDIRQLPRTRTEGQRDTTRYNTLLDTLLRLHDELSLLTDDSQIIGQFRALGAIARAKEEISRQRVQLLKGYYNPGSMDAKEVERFIASNAAQRSDITTVGQEAGPQVAIQLQKALTRPEYYNTELIKSRAITLASGKEPGVRIRQNLLASTDPGKISAADQWFSDNATTISALHSVEEDINKKLALRGTELRDAEVRNAVIAGVLILALLLLVALLTVAIARSMVTPLRRLRTEALEIAGFRLPDVVRKLRLNGDVVPEVRPIDVEGSDEIGEVAKAFDQVHRQAVRLAGEEAELRGNISSMFVNLSRRTQTLVERQISLIDGLEKGEQDGGRLADLFKLDHLATRMRRNSENLLVLAGHEPSRRRSQPAKLVDVVRAALSEVEGYERVQVKVHRGTSVVGSAANDLVHLVAELVENALQFSPSNAQVSVTSSLIEGGGALLSVTDAGISMTEDELTEANRRLAEPPVVDVSVSRRMGLFVVGRLALRHGIRVQLRKGDGNGLIAMVLLPPALVADGSQPPLPQRPAFAGSGDPAGVAPGRGPGLGGSSLTSPGLAGTGLTGPGLAGPGLGGPALAGSGAGGPGASGAGGRHGTPAQNGSFRSFGSLDSFGTAGNGTGRPGGPPFTADTDGGALRQPSYDTGGFPSYPSPDAPGGFPSYPSPDAPGGFPSYPSPDAPGGFPSHPGQEGAGGFPSAPPAPGTRGPRREGLPRREDLPGREDMPSRDPFPSREPLPSRDAFPSRDGFASRESFPSREGFPGAGSGNGAFQTPPPAPAASGYSTADVRRPESPPSVDVSPMDKGQEEYLPIFASVESAWFRRPPGEQATSAPGRDEHNPSQAVVSGEEAWRTAADAGWRAAAAASDPSLGGITAAGLPKRTPKANLVPGTAGSQAAQPQRQQRQAPAPPVSADRMRSRMASFQQGVRRGRAEVREQEEQE